MIRNQTSSNGELTIWNDESGKMVVTHKIVKLSESKRLEIQAREERIKIADAHLRRESYEIVL
jgi:hypothetical protein